MSRFCGRENSVIKGVRCEGRIPVSRLLMERGGVFDSRGEGGGGLLAVCYYVHHDSTISPDLRLEYFIATVDGKNRRQVI